jgi:hypothetical protein
MGDYQTDYQKFMLGYTSNSVDDSKATKSDKQYTPPCKSPSQKSFSSLVRAFQSTLQRDWIEVDENLASVLQSISNLRTRIYWSSQQRKNLLCTNRTDEMYMMRRPRIHLLPEDIELALIHEFNQHEKMMAGSRLLLASLNQAQEALGRRLAEILQYVVEMNDMISGGSWSPISSSVDTLEQTYEILAVELHCKQQSVQKVLDSTNDYLLATEESLVLDDENPRKSAVKCSSNWKLVSKIQQVQESLRL